MIDSKTSVLVVDDDPQIGNILKVVIEAKGYKTIACTSAKEGLSILRTSEIKLALIDIYMPEMNGLELLEKIQKITPSTQVIMITGVGDMEIAKKCMEAGAKDFITKPFDMDYLETSVLAQIIPLI